LKDLDAEGKIVRRWNDVAKRVEYNVVEAEGLKELYRLDILDKIRQLKHYGWASDKKPIKSRGVLGGQTVGNAKAVLFFESERISNEARTGLVKMVMSILSRALSTVKLNLAPSDKVIMIVEVNMLPKT